VPIEVPVAGACEDAIAPEVVEAVHVKLAGQQVLHPRWVVGIVRVDQLRDRLRQRLGYLCQDFVNFRVFRPNDLLGPVLVVDSQAWLEQVRKRTMPDIVD
jgi:hypothetical protein